MKFIKLSVLGMLIFLIFPFSAHILYYLAAKGLAPYNEGLAHDLARLEHEFLSMVKTLIYSYIDMLNIWHYM